MKHTKVRMRVRLLQGIMVSIILHRNLLWLAPGAVKNPKSPLAPLILPEQINDHILIIIDRQRLPYQFYHRLIFVTAVNVRGAAPNNMDRSQRSALDVSILVQSSHQHVHQSITVEITGDHAGYYGVVESTLQRPRAYHSQQRLLFRRQEDFHRFPSVAQHEHVGQFVGIEVAESRWHAVSEVAKHLIRYVAALDEVRHA